MGVPLLRGFAFAVSSALATMFTVLVALRLVAGLVVGPLFLIREIGVAMLTLYSGKLVGVLRLAASRLAMASDFRLILSQNSFMDVLKLNISEFIILGNDRDKHFPFLGHGSEQDHSLQLVGDSDGGGGTPLESGDHPVNLVAGVPIGLKANVQHFLEVPKDSSDGRSAVLRQKMVPLCLSRGKICDLLLNGSVDT